MEKFLLRNRQALQDDYTALSPLEYVKKARKVFKSCASEFVELEKGHFPQRQRVVSLLFNNYEHLMTIVDEMLTKKKTVFKNKLNRQLYRLNQKIEDMQKEMEVQVRKREESDAKLEEYLKKSQTLRDKLELFQRFVYVKTGRLDLQKWQDKMKALKEKKEINLRKIERNRKLKAISFAKHGSGYIPHTTTEEETMTVEGVEEQFRADQEALYDLLPSQLYEMMKQGNESTIRMNHKLQELDVGSDSHQTAEAIRHNVYIQLDELDSRANARSELSAPFEDVQRHEHTFLAEMTSGLEHEMSSYETTLNSFASNVISAYRSKITAACEVGCQTVLDPALSEDDFTIFTSSKGSGDTAMNGTPRSGQNTSREERDQTKISSTPREPMRVPRSPKKEDKEITSPLPSISIEEPGDVVVSARRVGIPICIPHEFRAILNSVNLDLEHNIDLSFHAVARLVEEIVAAKLHANQTGKFCWRIVLRTLSLSLSLLCICVCLLLPLSFLFRIYVCTFSFLSLSLTHNTYLSHPIHR